MIALPDILRTAGVREQLVSDAQALVEQELAAKTGVAAAALKVAYKAVTTFAPGYYQKTIDKMIPDMLDRLQPFWADFQAGGSGQFGEYLAGRGEEVSQALLSVTDAMAKASERPMIVKAYQSVREGAGKHIEAALPALGAMVTKYAS